MKKIILYANDNNGRTLESVTGAFGISFNQPIQQDYTEYGYPVAAPYDGSKLFINQTSADQVQAEFDKSLICAPSAFTGGSSGGPWVANGNAVSINDYIDSASTRSGSIIGTLRTQAYSFIV